MDRKLGIASCNKLLAYELRAIAMYQMANRRSNDAILVQAASTHLSNIVSLRIQIRLLGGDPCPCDTEEWVSETEEFTLDQLIHLETECITVYLEALSGQDLPTETRDLIRFTLVPDLKYSISSLRRMKRVEARLESTHEPTALAS